MSTSGGTGRPPRRRGIGGLIVGLLVISIVVLVWLFLPWSGPLGMGAFGEKRNIPPTQVPPATEVAVVPSATLPSAPPTVTPAPPTRTAVPPTMTAVPVTSTLVPAATRTTAPAVAPTNVGLPSTPTPQRTPTGMDGATGATAAAQMAATSSAATALAVPTGVGTVPPNLVQTAQAAGINTSLPSGTCTTALYRGDDPAVQVQLQRGLWYVIEQYENRPWTKDGRTYNGHNIFRAHQAKAGDFVTAGPQNGQRAFACSDKNTAYHEAERTALLVWPTKPTNWYVGYIDTDELYQQVGGQ